MLYYILKGVKRPPLLGVMFTIQQKRWNTNQFNIVGNGSETGCIQSPPTFGSNRLLESDVLFCWSLKSMVRPIDGAWKLCTLYNIIFVYIYIKIYRAFFCEMIHENSYAYKQVMLKIHHLLFDDGAHSFPCMCCTTSNPQSFAARMSVFHWNYSLVTYATETTTFRYDMYAFMYSMFPSQRRWVCVGHACKRDTSATSGSWQPSRSPFVISWFKGNNLKWNRHEQTDNIELNRSAVVLCEINQTSNRAPMHESSGLEGLQVGRVRDPVAPDSTIEAPVV